jgi:drug/metabolite transporter (DMT)-like permease
MDDSRSSQHRLRIIIAFACVYFFWGSTFVGIRYGVQFVSPFLISGLRTVAASLLLLLALKMRGVSLRMNHTQLQRTALYGVLLVTVNNSMLGFAERYVSAGYAALLTACVPIAIAVIEAIIPGGKPLSRVGWIGTALGVGGLALLLEPALRAGLSAQEPGTPTNPVLKGTLILLCGISGWVSGALLSSRRPAGVNPLLGAAFQMLMGGSANVVLGTLTGGWQTAHWNAGVFYALVWLAIGGSLIGYSAFTYLLQNVAVAKVTTNAYVNPMVAVILSTLFLHETLHGSQWIAMGIILVAVAIVTASSPKTDRESTVSMTAVPEEG